MSNLFSLVVVGLQEKCPAIAGTLFFSPLP